MSSQQPLQVIIIGAGIAGIAQAISLRKRLRTRVEITILEKADTIGGVWRDARWPGAGVDVPIHFYALWSEPKCDWTKFYAEQSEVLEYWELLLDKYDLRSRVLLQTEYVASAWDEERHLHITTLQRRDGSTFDAEAHVLISANGPLSTPQIPEIRGLDAFEGEYFHNLRWPHGVKLAGKRVAVIGNGSSGVQLVPGVAALPGVELTHFIRSGGYFLPKNNYRYGPWTIWAFRHIPLIQRLHRLSLFLESNNRWRAKRPAETKQLESKLITYLKETAPAKYHDALLPDYPLGCKRVAYDDGWLRSLHRDNVELVRSNIVEATPKGLRAFDGKERAFDVIIFATGSNVAQHGVGVNIGLKGEQNVELRQTWDTWGGPKAYMGTAVPGFPNYLIILGPNATAGSWGYTIGVKTEFNTSLIKHMIDHGITSIQPTQDAFERHNHFIQEKLTQTNMNSLACHNWWRVGGQGLMTVPNAITGFEFARITQTIRFGDWIFKRHSQGGKAVVVAGVPVTETRSKRGFFLLGGILSLVSVGIAFYRTALKE